jgi:hypothetical protein
MPLERRDVEAALTKKGFRSSEGDHNFFTYWTVAGQKTSVYTKTSHGSGHKTLSDDLVSRMARQCGITARDFKRLVACPLSRTDLEKALLGSGRISAQRSEEK